MPLTFLIKMVRSFSTSISLPPNSSREISLPFSSLTQTSPRIVIEGEEGEEDFDLFFGGRRRRWRWEEDFCVGWRESRRWGKAERRWRKRGVCSRRLRQRKRRKTKKQRRRRKSTTTTFWMIS